MHDPTTEPDTAQPEPAPEQAPDDGKYAHLMPYVMAYATTAEPDATAHTPAADGRFHYSVAYVATDNKSGDRFGTAHFALPTPIVNWAQVKTLRAELTEPGTGVAILSWTPLPGGTGE